MHPKATPDKFKQVTHLSAYKNGFGCTQNQS